MSIVNVKCPNCGASIQLDSDREEGFCSYCGSKVKVQEAINKVKIDKSGDLKNLLNLANAAIEANNGQEALNYANKTLEVDSQNGEAWYIKMQAQGLLSTLGDLKCNDVVTAGRKAIEFDSSEEMKLNVYDYYLNKCLYDFQFMMTELQDTKAMKDIYDANCQLNAFNATENTSGADYIADLCWTQDPDVVGLKLAVPDSYITNNPELARITGEIAKQLVYYQNAFNARLNVYGTNLNDTAMAKYKQYLSQIKQGLPTEMQNVIGEESLNNQQAGCPTETQNVIGEENLNNQQAGCYVATAVYGSYDCPEVWTLRRFRDYTLAETWYGRAFIHSYYAISPTLVKLFGQSSLFKRIWKEPLDNLVKTLQSKGYENTPYNDRKW